MHTDKKLEGNTVRNRKDVGNNTVYPDALLTIPESDHGHPTAAAMMWRLIKHVIIVFAYS